MESNELKDGRQVRQTELLDDLQKKCIKVVNLRSFKAARWEGRTTFSISTSFRPISPRLFRPQTSGHLLRSHMTHSISTSRTKSGSDLVWKAGTICLGMQAVPCASGQRAVVGRCRDEWRGGKIGWRTTGSCRARRCQ